MKVTYIAFSGDRHIERQCVVITIKTLFGFMFLSFYTGKLRDNTVIPRLTKIIRSGITFVSRNLR